MKQVQAQIMHSPTLNTVLMVESTLKDAQETVSLAKLKKMLPKKVMHRTLLQVIDYLQESGKIFIGTKGITWIYRPREELEKMMQNSLQVR